MAVDPPGSPSPAGGKRPSFVDRHLDPNDSVGELLFGVIMALSITLGAGLVVHEGPEATEQILIGVLGCNVAWGLIDGAMYLMNIVLERSRKLHLVAAIQAAPSEAQALALIEGELDEGLEPIASPAVRRNLYERALVQVKAMELEGAGVRKEDLLGAVAVFWLVSRSALPTILPFLVLDDRFLALRVANLLLLAMLFLAGWRWARATRGNPWRVGTTLVLIGLGLVAVAIALGG